MIYVNKGEVKLSGNQLVIGVELSELFVSLIKTIDGDIIKAALETAEEIYYF